MHLPAIESVQCSYSEWILVWRCNRIVIYIRVRQTGNTVRYGFRLKSHKSCASNIQPYGPTHLPIIAYKPIRNTFSATRYLHALFMVHGNAFARAIIWYLSNIDENEVLNRKRIWNLYVFYFEPVKPPQMGKEEYQLRSFHQNMSGVFACNCCEELTYVIAANVIVVNQFQYYLLDVFDDRGLHVVIQTQQKMN